MALLQKKGKSVRRERRAGENDNETKNGGGIEVANRLGEITKPRRDGTWPLGELRLVADLPSLIDPASCHSLTWDGAVLTDEDRRWMLAALVSAWEKRTITEGK